MRGIEMRRGLAGLLLLALLLTLAGCVAPQAPVADEEAGLGLTRGTYIGSCYKPEGGNSYTCDSGGSFDVNSGATLNVNAGTVSFEGATADDYEGVFAVTDPTAERTWTLPNVSGTIMLTSTPGAIVLGTNTITGTLTISHGLTTPQTVFCTLLQDSEANAATCSATISGGTVVVKTWKADGATAGSVGKIVSWMVGGQP